MVGADITRVVLAILLIPLSSDPAFIPQLDLPLQRMIIDSHTVSFLSFEPPPASLVVPFLQLVALSEGHHLSAAALERLYAGSAYLLPTWIDNYRVPSWNDVSYPKRQLDLRKTLAQLQLQGKRLKAAETAGALGDGGPARKLGTDEVLEVKLDAMVVTTEAISFADAFVARRYEILLEVRNPPPVHLRSH